MELNTLVANRDLVLAVMAGFSACSAILVVFWQYFVRDVLDARLRQLADEHERIRMRERARLQSAKGAVSLRSQPRQLFTRIVGQLNLAKEAEDGTIGRRLRMAGYRGHAPVINFLAIRVIAPLLMLAISLFYIFVVVQLQQPFFVKLSIALGATWFAYYLPAIYIKNRITKRQAAIRRYWPDALELLLICVESGMSFEAALRKVSEEFGSQSPHLAVELSVTTAELSYLQDRRQAYENLGERTGLDEVKAMVTSLVQAEKYGTSLGQTLRVLAQESRAMRMSEAEKKAAALPPKLTVPMILFFLPILFAIIITPAAIKVLELH